MRPKPETMTTGEMAAAFGFSSCESSQARTWIRAGHARVQNARPGKGQDFAVPLSAVFAITLGTTVLRHGMSGDAAAKIVRYLDRADVPGRLARGERFLVVQGERVWLASEVASIATGGEAVTVLMLTVAMQAFRQALERHRKHRQPQRLKQPKTKARRSRACPQTVEA